MPRSQRRAIADLEARLRTLEDRSSALSWLVGELHAQLGVYAVGAYGVQTLPAALRLEFGYWAGGAGARSTALFDDWLGRNPGKGWGLFDPERVAPAMRDRIVLTRSPGDIARGLGLPRGSARERVIRDLLQSVGFLGRMGWDRPHARMLVCDGPRLLAFVGIVDDDRLTPPRLALFRAVAPAIVRRVRLERRLRHPALTDAAFQVVLDAVPAAAFVLARHGRILHANAAARAWFDRERAVVRAALSCRHGPDPHVFEVTSLGADCVLAIRRHPPRDAATRVAHATRRWGLTAREAQVLHHLAHGATNLRIASELGCAEATAEIHVSRILAKADAENRAELVAKIWTA